MKKKIVAVLVAILLSTSLITVAFAKQGNLPFKVGKIIPEIVIPRRPEVEYPDVRVIVGVAVDKETLETEPVILLVINYREKTNSYLLVDGELYRMKKVKERYDWETGARIFQYEAEDGSIMTLMVQRFREKWVMGISADFKGYLITFEPVYGKRLAKPSILEARVYKEIVEKLTKEKGFELGKILKKPAKPFVEWTS